MRKLFILFILILPILAFAQSDQTWNVGLKIGPLFPGTVNIGAAEVDTETGFIFDGSIDAMVTPKLSMGACLLYASTSAADFNADATVITFGGTLKARFDMENDMQVRTGGYIGYQMSEVDVPGSKDSQGLGLGALVELVYPLQNGGALVGELSFLSQPAGGNADDDVTWAPIFFLAFGYEFGGK